MNALDALAPQQPERLELYTLGEAADLLGIAQWKLTRAYALGRLPEPARCGTFRALTEADIQAARLLLCGVPSAGEMTGL